MTPAVRDILFSGPPGWVLRGTVPADLDFDFANGRYWQRGIGFGADSSQFLTCSRASTGYAQTREGLWLPFGSNVARITNQGLLVEEARTNSIRNNSMQGAVAGSPGTLPTNWIATDPSGNGITRTIVGMGTTQGIDYIDIRWSGAPTATSSFVVRFEGLNIIAASSGQTWTASLFMQVIAGSYANFSANVLTVLGTNGSGQTEAFNKTVSANNLFTSYSNTATIANGSTTNVTSNLLFNYSSGQPVNITLRIGWPQLELGAFATSPIRTTSAAVTRAADVVTVAQPPLFGSAYTLFGEAIPGATISYGATQVVFTVDGGSASNRATMFRNLTTAFPGIFTVSSNGPASVQLNALSAWPQNVKNRMAYSVAAGRQTFYFAGGIGNPPNPVTTNPLPVGVNRVPIGVRSDLSTQFFNGLISRLTLWANTAQPDPVLQAITAP